MKVKLIKGLSFNGTLSSGKAICATVRTPEVELDCEEEAAEAVATGYFEAIELTFDDEKTPDDDENTAADIKKLVAKMTTEALVKLAEEKEIDISDCKNNTERRAAILAVLDDENSSIDFTQ